VPAELEELHARVRPAYALKELHTYEIDYPGLLATREALLGFGRRLVSPVRPARSPTAPASAWTAPRER
jgi:hypothetical protein